MGARVRQKNGDWWVFIHHDGQRTSKKVGDKKAAEVVAAKIQAKLVLGDFNFEEPASAKPVTFQDTAERWLESYAKVHCRPSTHDGYRRLLHRFAYPRFGNKPLSAISREDLKGLIAEMGAKGLSKSSIKAAVAPIREIYYHAIDDGHQLQNPAAKMGRFLKDKTDRRLKITPLSAEEVQCLLDAAATCDQDRAESPSRDVFPSLWLFLLCTVRTGLRLGEILGLQWGDLDFRGKFIEVRRQFTKRQLALTKSGKIRRVDMSDQLGEAFRQAKDIREAELAIEGREFDPEEPVFRNRAGSRLDESRVSKTILRRCLLLAGLRHVRFHDLRHTFASLLLANGESLVYVKDQLGHHSIQITVDIYGHLIPGSNRAAVNRLDTAPDRTPRAPTRRVVTPQFSETPEKESVGGGVWGSNPPTRY
jgi:integrase